MRITFLGGVAVGLGDKLGVGVEVGLGVKSGAAPGIPVQLRLETKRTPDRTNKRR
jgi:hypothetical protein